MQYKDNHSTYTLSRSDTMRFRSIVIDVMSEAANIDAPEENGGIGTLGEKLMHAAIKRFICPDPTYHEVKLDTRESEQKKRRFVADILKDGTVTEIQTGRLAPLTEKIRWILENTSYNVTVIHPIAESKWINLLNAKNEIEARYRSPFKGKLRDIACELYAIKEFLNSSRFSLVILMVEAEQYKKNTAKSSRHRKKLEKYELIPVNLLSATVFSCVEDLKIFIPDSLEGDFTVKQFSAASKIRGMDAYSTIHTLCDLGLIEACGKSGRSNLYRKTY